MINVSISESHVSLDRYLSCYTSVEQMAIQIRHSTDVSFQRPGKFNLTVHVNEKFIELWGQCCGLQVEKVVPLNITEGPAIQKRSKRSFLNQAEKTQTAAAAPERQAWGRLGGKRPGLTTSSRKILRIKKGKMTILNILSFHVEREHGLVVYCGNRE